MSMLLNIPQGESPVLQRVPASASNVNDPLAVPPPPKVTPLSVQVIGVAEALSESMSNANTVCAKRIMPPRGLVQPLSTWVILPRPSVKERTLNENETSVSSPSACFEKG
jgi:hypothetical protein